MFMSSTFAHLLPLTLTTMWLVSIWFQPVAWAGGDGTLSEGKSQREARRQTVQPTVQAPLPHRAQVAPVAPRQTMPRTVQAPTPSYQVQRRMQSEPKVTVADSDSALQSFYKDLRKPGNFELGVIGGEPLGLSAKVWLSPTRAIDAGLGWSLIGDTTNLSLHTDYLFHNFNALKVNSGSLPLYYGLGARFRFGEDSRFGIRVPMGAQYISSSRIFSLFLEVAPIISFIPDAEVDLNVGLGVRFFFFE